MSEQDSKKSVVVSRFPYAGQAEIARVQLAEEGINSIISGGDAVPMDWALGVSARGFRLEVLESDAHRALEILRRATPDRAIDEWTDEAGNEDRCLSCGDVFPANETFCGNCGWSFNNADDADSNEEFRSGGPEKDSQFPSDSASFLERIRPVARSAVLFWAGIFGMMLLWTVAAFAQTLARSV